MIEIDSSALVGFGEPLPSERARDYVVDRRDLRVAAPSDLYILAAVRAVLPDLWGSAQASPDIAFFLSGSKKLTGGIMKQAWRQRGGEAGGLVKMLQADQAQLDTQVVHPFWTISALPNLAMYLVAKSFGLTGFSDHYICEPWADVAAMFMADVHLQNHEARSAVVVSATLGDETDSAVVSTGEPLREMPAASEREGSAGVLLRSSREDGAPSLAPPLLAVSRDGSVRRAALSAWLDELGSVDRLLVAGDPEFAAWVDDRRSPTAGPVELLGMPRHPAPTLTALVVGLRKAPTAAVIVDHGDAVTGLAVVA